MPAVSQSAVIVTATLLRELLPKNVDLHERVKFAMREVRKPNSYSAFMCSTDDERFRGAVAALLVSGNYEERVIILYACYTLQKIMKGVDLDDLDDLEMDALRLIWAWNDADPNRKENYEH